ncbi:MAG: LacI family DNA-binding transcriptional regulator [Flavobacteriales bacterium]|jgi:LacI family transcriptional regulator
MKRATIKDIALLMKVSVSTVSRGLRDHPDISSELCAQIKAKAKELNYHPNHLASGLRKRQSKFIALIIPEITMFFFPSVINGIEEVARKQGYQLLVLQSNDSLENEKLNIQACFDHSVDGVLISLSNQSLNADHLLDLKESGIPVVLFDKSIENSAFDEVLIDDELAGYQATHRLIEKGCRKIIAVLGSQSLTMTKLRGRGIRRALEESKIPITEQTFGFAESFEKGREVIAKMLVEQRPDGIYLMSDELIAAASTIIQKVYGNDHSQCHVIGMSDGQLPKIVPYPVSYVHHSGFELGQLAANRLMKRIFLVNDEIDQEAPQRILLPTAIIDSQFAIGNL